MLIILEITENQMAETIQSTFMKPSKSEAKKKRVSKLKEISPVRNLLFVINEVSGGSLQSNHINTFASFTSKTIANDFTSCFVAL